MDARAHLLLVDDHAEGLEALTEVLSVLGYRVTSAATGEAAIAHLGAEPFDALVLDLGLPDVDGIAVLRAARSCSHPPAAVVFTGHHRLREEAEEAGCDAYILKPELEQLVAQLQTLLQERSAKMRVPKEDKRA